MLRNELDHEEQLNLIENAPTKFFKEYYSKLFGVNGRSKLEEAPYFNVCQQLPQDVMYVFLEGGHFLRTHYRILPIETRRPKKVGYPR